MRKLTMSFATTALVFAALMLSAAPSFALNSGGCVAECVYPYDAALQIYMSASPATAQDAIDICNDFMDIYAAHWVTNGFMIRWLNGAPPATGQPGNFTCFACVDAELPKDLPERLPEDQNIRLETAASAVIGVYGGEATTARRFFIDDLETGAAAASYMFRISGSSELERSSGMVALDPRDGQLIRHHPVNCEER